MHLFALDICKYNCEIIANIAVIFTLKRIRTNIEQRYCAIIGELFIFVEALPSTIKVCFIGIFPLTVTCQYYMAAYVQRLLTVHW